MMITDNIKKISHRLHIDDLLKSMNECRKDNSGDFLIPTSAKISDSEYARYRHLPINWSIPPITKDDLPEEFSPQAVKTVDMFRRKTIDLPYECMLYFDYISGDIVSCSFSNQNSPDEVNGVFYRYLLKKCILLPFIITLNNSVLHHLGKTLRCWDWTLKSLK